MVMRVSFQNLASLALGFYYYLMFPFYGTAKAL